VPSPSRSPREKIVVVVQDAGKTALGIRNALHLFEAAVPVHQGNPEATAVATAIVVASVPKGEVRDAIAVKIPNAFSTAEVALDGIGKSTGGFGDFGHPQHSSRLGLQCGSERKKQEAQEQSHGPQMAGPIAGTARSLRTKVECVFHDVGMAC
jgi:hypothetical protein